ncbi:hypothetical protein KIN20_024495 [Parelaphostrongylus tenuis]|uniref:Uncharacterized protein n=1 Tax=Parelaphostrongylus tenuis TaxID=148309 RepID=A0AAD5N884_PARTN|nr:hypothetical protein KIN20_024495 [Parelaphostrongylus tenuis]
MDVPNNWKNAKQHRKLYNEWVQTAKAVGLKPSILTQSKIQSPTCPVLYMLIKTQLERHNPAHLTNTRMFLDRLRNANPNKAFVMESFDGTSLYTNVSNDSASQATHGFLRKHQGAVNMFGLLI